MTEFNARSDTGKLRNTCKECAKKRCVERYASLSEDIKKADHQKAIANQNFYLESRCDHTCQVCGTKYPSEVLDFHHVDPSTKKSGLNLNKWRGNKVRQSTIDEAAKCAILCANCHRLEHKALREGRSLLDENNSTRCRDRRIETLSDLVFLPFLIT